MNEHNIYQIVYSMFWRSCWRIIQMQSVLTIEYTPLIKNENWTMSSSVHEITKFWRTLYIFLLCRIFFINVQCVVIFRNINVELYFILEQAWFNCVALLIYIYIYIYLIRSHYFAVHLLYLLVTLLKTLPPSFTEQYLIITKIC